MTLHARAAWIVLASGLLMAPDAVRAAMMPLGGIASTTGGDAHTCSIGTDGAVHCWGDNDFGQLGDGSLSDRLTATPVLGLRSGVTAAGAGAAHTCVVQAGAAKCFGDNTFGQLGDGTTIAHRAPSVVSGLGTGVVDVTSGAAGNHACALTAAGAVLCWGNNDFGQLGDGSTTTRLAPVPVSGLGSGVAAISAGDTHTCALLTGGGVRCWGLNVDGRVGDGSTTQRTTPVDVAGLSSGVVEIAAGGAHACARLAGGTLRCWGRNTYGALGDGTTTTRTTPVAVSGVAGATNVSAGDAHTCAVAGGAARCWGYNRAGGLGDGTTTSRTTAVPVAGLSSGVASVSARRLNTCATLMDGGVRCWGSNREGQIGDGAAQDNLAPDVVEGLSAGVTDVAGGATHTCAVQAGAAKCLGDNAFGQLGDGTTDSRSSPVTVAGLGTGVVAVTAGAVGNHTCALTVAGAALCWGRNDYGQLGDGTTTHRATPVAVSGLGSGVAAISAGDTHTCALLTGGAVRCWGFNVDGRVGDGTTTQRLTPVAVSGLGSGVAEIASGGAHACARLDGGTLRCWGRNTYGALGDGSTSIRTTPVAVSGVTGATNVSAGDAHTCAVTTGGAVRCWGLNRTGALGDGTTTSRTTAVGVVGLASGVASVSARRLHTCAALQGGGVRCWGNNRDGQIGDGTTVDRLVPKATSGLSRVNALRLSGGDGHSCAVSTTNVLRCWGDDEFAKGGGGEARDYTVPRTVMSDVQDTRVIELDVAAAGDVASDASGRYLVYTTRSALDPADTNGAVDVYRVDTTTGAALRISVDDDEQQIAGDSAEPSVSADGTLVAFIVPAGAVDKLRGESKAMRSARMKAAGNVVLLRNLLTGASQRIGTGIVTPPSGARPVVAPDGSAVLFAGPVANAGTGALGQTNVHKVPLVRGSGGSVTPGASRCISCKTIDAQGNETGVDSDGESSNAVVSGDGTYAVWETKSQNLATGQPSPCPAASDVVIRNLLTGVSQRVSSMAGLSPSGCGQLGIRKPSVDWSGRRIVFESDHPLAATDGSQATDVYLLETSGLRTTRLSENRQGHDGDAEALEPRISGDGRVVAFRSKAANLEPRIPDNNDEDDVYVTRLDRPGLHRISRNRLGDLGDGASRLPALNYTGTGVAFESDAANLAIDALTGASLDTNGVTDVFQVANPIVADVVFGTGFE